MLIYPIITRLQAIFCANEMIILWSQDNSLKKDSSDHGRSQLPYNCTDATGGNRPKLLLLTKTNKIRIEKTISSTEMRIKIRLSKKNQKQNNKLYCRFTELK